MVWKDFSLAEDVPQNFRRNKLLTKIRYSNFNLFLFILSPLDSPGSLILLYFIGINFQTKSPILILESIP